MNILQKSKKKLRNEKRSGPDWKKAKKKAYDNRTPEQQELYDLKKQMKRAAQREFDGKNRKKSIVALREGMESDAYEWPNALLQDLKDDREFSSSVRGNPEIKCAQKYLSKINHEALEKVSCAVCWELTSKKTCKFFDYEDPSARELLENLRTYGVVHEKAASDFVFLEPFSAFNGLPLLKKAMNVDDGTIRVCHICMSHLTHDDPSKRLPPRSVANDLWFGDASELVKSLSIPAKLLICPVRQKAYIVKLKVKGDPRTRQRAVLGSTIAFTQDNVLVEAVKLPHNLSELSRSLSVIFVGNKPPSEAQLAKVFHVDAQDLKKVLDEFRANGHLGFQHGSWNMEELETWEANGGTTSSLLQDCIHNVDSESERTVLRETRTYANITEGTDDFLGPEDDDGLESEDDGGDYEDGDVILHPCGLVNSNGVADDRVERNHRAFDALRQGHHDDPVNTYGNPEYWVNSMPWLFPFGSGGAEVDRFAKLTLTEWVRHCLNFHDDRFRRDPAFIFIVYKCLQIRDRVTMTNVLFKTSINAIGKAATNAVSVADFTYALDVLEGKKTLFGCDDVQVQRVTAMIRNIKIVGRQSADSVFARDACRSKMMGLVTAYNLPSLFITLNPSDIFNPLVSCWHNAEGGKAFDMDTLLPEFPTQSERGQIVANDPVHASEMFDTVVNAFMEAFLGFENREVNGLSGKLINGSLFTGEAESSGLQAAFGTVECQGRGSLHIHLLVWLAGVPSSKELMRRIEEAVEKVKASLDPTPSKSSAANDASPKGLTPESGKIGPEIREMDSEDVEMTAAEDINCEVAKKNEGVSWAIDDHFDAEEGDFPIYEVPPVSYLDEWNYVQNDEDSLDSQIAAYNKSCSGADEVCSTNDGESEMMTEAFVRDNMPYKSLSSADMSSEERAIDSDEVDICSIPLGREDTVYRHKNAHADGRCSIHAAGDILGLSIDETVDEFQKFVTLRCLQLDKHLHHTCADVEVQAYFATVRSTARSVYADCDLLDRYKNSVSYEIRMLTELLTNVYELFNNGDQWMGTHGTVVEADNWRDRIGGSNTAAMGSHTFDSFIESYFKSRAGVLVKVVSIKVPHFQRGDSVLKKKDVRALLLKSGYNLKSGIIKDYFERNRLVMFLEVAEGHFHTVVSTDLLDDEFPSQQSNNSFARKRSHSDSFEFLNRLLTTYKKPCPATSSSSGTESSPSSEPPVRLRPKVDLLFSFLWMCLCCKIFEKKNLDFFQSVPA